MRSEGARGLGGGGNPCRNATRILILVWPLQAIRTPRSGNGLPAVTLKSPLQELPTWRQIPRSREAAVKGAISVDTLEDKDKFAFDTVSSELAQILGRIARQLPLTKESLARGANRPRHRPSAGLDKTSLPLDALGRSHSRVWPHLFPDITSGHIIPPRMAQYIPTTATRLARIRSPHPPSTAKTIRH